ncbi:MAG: hypothetical protein ACKV2O_09090 [Acidimicrobiales bacterium]
MRQAVSTAWGLTVLLVALVGVAVGVGSWRSSREGPLPASLEGPCQVQARLSPSGVVVDPSVSGGVYEVPPTALIEYTAVLSDLQDPGSRLLQGQVGLDLPPPFGLVNVARWSEPGSSRGEDGTYRYNLPRRWAPTGVTLRVQAEHTEPALRCAGALTVRLTGPAFGSFLRPVALVLMVGSAWLVARAGTAPAHRHDPWSARHRRPGSAGTPGAPRPVPPWQPRGRPVFGVLVGLVFGAFAAVVALLAGAVVLHSAWVSASVVGGAAIGLLIGWVGPISTRKAEIRPAASDEPRELPLLEPQ